jgi:rhamnosyl/mannosyltransferase
VVATDSHLGHAQDIGVEARTAKVRVIPYGVDADLYRPGENPKRPKLLPPPSGEAIGLFVGRLVSYKGLDVLLDAVTGTTLRLVIVGDGPLRATLQQRIAERRLGDRVVLAGRMSDDAMPGLYQATDYCVLPSTTPAEMFGIVQLEAMACGRPVISTALSTGVREVNVPEVTGLVVPPGDSVALRGAMETLAGDAELRARLGEAGRRRVLARFTVKQMIDAHLELCAELMPRRDS